MKCGEPLQQLSKFLNGSPSGGEPADYCRSGYVIVTGRLREHDVVLTFSMQHHELIVALCRDRSRKVGVPEIEAFKKKCERTGIHRGIIVSSLGFSKSALEKARTMDIGCFTLSQIEKFDWCQHLESNAIHEKSSRGLISRFFHTSRWIRLQLFTTKKGLLRQSGCARSLLIACTNGRLNIASAQDAAAINSSIGLFRFIHSNPSEFHVLNSSEERIALQRLEITLRYQVRTSLVPFKFRQYVDEGTGRNSPPQPLRR